MPFGPYKEFSDCVRANRDKKDPEAYCATIHKEITGQWPGQLRARAAKEALTGKKGK